MFLRSVLILALVVALHAKDTKNAKDSKGGVTKGVTPTKGQGSSTPKTDQYGLVIKTYDGTKCQTLDMTYTGRDLNSGKCIEVKATSATKGDQGKRYVKGAVTDSVWKIEVFAKADCTGESSSIVATKAETVNALAGKCAVTEETHGGNKKEAKSAMISGNLAGRKQCDREKIKTAYEKCVKVKDAKVADCDKQMKAALTKACGVAPTAAEEKKLKDEAATKEAAACRMAAKDKTAKEECDKKFRETMGLKALPTGDKMTAADKKDQMKDKLAAEKGANTAVADAMNACTKTKAQCKTEMVSKLANMKGRTMTQGEVDGALREAGASAAGAAIKACIEAAATRADEAKCKSSDAAKEAFAKASGRDAKDIKETDLKQAAKKGAMGDVKDTFKACYEVAEALAADKQAAAMKACRSGDDLKQKIAEGMGGDAADVKSSMVKHFLNKGTQDDLLAVVKGCDKGADKAQCLEVMKELKAKATGRKAEDITKDDLKKDSREALKNSLGSAMQACMEAATTADAKKECSTLAKTMMKEGDIDGKEPSKGKIEEALRGAAKADAGQVMQDCTGDRKTCMEEVKARIANVLGKAGGKVSNKDAEKFAKDGALDNAKDMAKSCVQSKKEDASATCDGKDELYTAYKNARKQAKPTSAAKEKQEKSKFMMETVAKLKKESRAICFEYTNKTAADECMKTFKEQDADVAKEYLKGEGSKATAKVLSARTKLAENKATTEYLGERFGACMRAAGSNKTEKDACMKDIEAKKAVAGVTTSAKAVLKKFRARAVAEAANVCNATERKACIESAKADMVEGGLKAREFGMIKKLGEITAAAEVYATCMQSDVNASDCAVLAKEEYLAVSGSDASVWDKVKAKVTKLADGIQNGVEIVMKKKMQIAIDAITSGTSCSKNATDALVAKIKSMTLTPALIGVKPGGCRLVDGLAEHAAMVGVKNFTDAQIETAADTINTGLLNVDLSTSRRLLIADVRRLATVSTVYTAQESEACASDDTSCGVTDTDLEGGSTTAGTTGSGSTTAGTSATSGTSSTATTAGDGTGTASSASAMQLSFIGALMVLLMYASH